MKKKKKERKGTRCQFDMTYFYCFTELKLIPDDLLTVTTHLLKKKNTSAVISLEINAPASMSPFIRI